MENYEFHRDYSAYWDDLDDSLNGITDNDKKLISTMYDFGFNAPQILNPIRKRAFDRLLIKSDTFGKKHGCIVDGMVNYNNYLAHISLIAPGFEFDEYEAKRYLRDAVRLADSVFFYPADKGRLNLRAEFELFAAEHTTEEIAEHKEKIQKILSEE